MLLYCSGRINKDKTTYTVHNVDVMNTCYPCLCSFRRNLPQGQLFIIDGDELHLGPRVPRSTSEGE